MELMDWMLVAVGIALALATQWFLLAQFSRDWKPMRDQIAEQVTQSAALVEECASGFVPKA
ncbi:hypothetical protein SAMN05216567_101288 [Variovorax sp. OK605]|jgi:hypothetical protein|uniref:hypothetical protein n=1 Tax=unclassified Variovorax TaxID=663243 RepID=UPI0008B06127|nr:MULTISPECIES: hypothetical protein [unclassified Variovorax]SEJ76202.1 hypothetical protein SAMN05518853_103449 [Variovorax sp. OK202]SFC89177.1 hypothetical protein SAMN05444746_103449 [Variovorax sp. OK212]SFO55238.1 hypothetical protein SAMN05216567_101288 [Variovorax sp. OK605]